MADYEGPAELEWRAHRYFAITSRVRVSVTAVAESWHARLVMDEGDPELDELALSLGNPYTLRFEDGSAFDVELAEPSPDGTIVIREWKGA